MPSTLSPAAIQQLDEVMAAYPRPGAPGTVVGVVNKEGKMIYLKATGAKNSETGEPLTEDTVFWIASCTKMVTGIAAMQLVEQGKLNLDEPIGTLVPELADVELIYESSETHFKTRKASKAITLKMLLTHTAGFTYSWYSEHIRNWVKQNESDEFSALKLHMPLVHEPGDAFDYGINMDWVGIAIERASGMTLGDYCDKHIFGPLGLTDITFNMPAHPELNERISAMHRWDMKNNTYKVEEHLAARTKPTVQSGGGGIFSTASDYLTIVSVLLNDGKGPSGVQIVKPETMKLMFQNHAEGLKEPGALGNSAAPTETTDTSIAGDALTLLPGTPKGWGYSFLLNLADMPNARKAYSAEWGGIANLFWHADPTSGIGSIIFCNILPYGDPAFYKMEKDLEKALYTPGHIVMDA